MMNKKYWAMAAATISLTLLMSACGTTYGSAPNDNNSTPPTSTAENSQGSGTTPTSTTKPADDSDKEILIIIDQTPKPTDANSFDFVVNKRPEGYALAEMRWKSEKHDIVNTVQQAIEHGGNGEDGFYISGNGQFMGFFYPDDMKGEKGEVSFLFKNEAGDELTWKKEITLK